MQKMKETYSLATQKYHISKAVFDNNFYILVNIFNRLKIC